MKKLWGFFFSVLLIQGVMAQSQATAILAAKSWDASSFISASGNVIAYDPPSGLLAIAYEEDRLNSTENGRFTATSSIDQGQNFYGGGFFFNPPVMDSGILPNLLISNPTQSTDPLNPNLVTSILIWKNYSGEVFSGTNAFSLFPTYQMLWANDAYSQQGAVDQNSGRAAFLLRHYDNVNYQTTGMSVASTVDNGMNWTVDPVLNVDEIYGAGVDSLAGKVNTVMIDIAPNGTDMAVAWQGIDENGQTQFGFKRSDNGGVSWGDVTYLKANDHSFGIPDSIQSHLYTPDLIFSAENMHFINTYTSATEQWVYEVFLDGSSNWHAKEISPVRKLGWVFYSGEQALNETEFARTDDGQFIFAKWQDAPNDSVDAPDIFIAGRSIHGEWSDPINITNTPNVQEKFSNLATRLTTIADTEDSLTVQLHIIYTILGHGDTDATAESEIWYLQNARITLPKPMINDIKEQPGAIPERITLMQNYPNPFNPVTTITFSIDNPAGVTLEIYNISGEKVATAADGFYNSGEHEIAFDGSGLSSGIYFYTLRSGNFSQTRKMILMQ